MPKSWATPPKRNRQKFREMAPLPRNVAVSGSSVGWVRRNGSMLWEWEHSTKFEHNFLSEYGHTQTEMSIFIMCLINLFCKVLPLPRNIASSVHFWWYLGVHEGIRWLLISF